MSKIVTKDQSIVTGVTHPKPVYSRVLSCGVSVGAMVGYTACWTPSPSDNIWLLGVDVWGAFNLSDADLRVRFRVKTLCGDPARLESSAIEALDDVIPVAVTNSAWRFYERNTSYHWDIKRLYRGGPRRFGLSVYDHAGVFGYVYASFQISEV